MSEQDLVSAPNLHLPVVLRHRVEDRSRFVPVRRRDLLPLLLTERQDDEEFARFVGLLHHVLRFEADARSERLQEAYAPFDPDPLVPATGDEGDEAAFLDAMDAVLEEANYRLVSEEELAAALESRSLFPLRAEVDLDEYDILRLYRRGVSEREERVRGWSTLWRWRTHRVRFYERLVVVLRLRSQRPGQDGPARTVDMEPGRIYLKSFKNVPDADIEMVLPNTRLRMRRLDRALVGGPLALGVGWTLFQSLGVLLAVLAGSFALRLDDPRLRALGGVLLVLAGYLWRTHNKVKTTRLRYMQTLSQGLYFRNLANNRAVLDQTLAAAQDEEEKEALLAYHILGQQGDGGSTAQEVDRQAEAWIQDRLGKSTDFDVQDGLGRLRELEVAREEGGQWRAVELGQAIEVLDRRWDQAFTP